MKLATDRRKIRILQGPICVLPSGTPLPVDAELCEDLIRKHARLTAFGYHPPLLVEHETDGEIRGRVLGLEMEPPEGARPLSLLADVEFYEEGAKEKLDSGAWSYFSPRLGSLWGDSLGREFSFPTVLEVSRVSMPHQTSIVDGFVVMSANKQLKVIPMTEAEFNALKAQLATLSADLEAAKQEAEKAKAEAKMSQAKADFVAMGFDPAKQKDEFDLYNANPTAFAKVAPRLKPTVAEAKMSASPDFSRPLAPASKPPTGTKQRISREEFNKRVDEAMAAQGISEFRALRALETQYEVV